MSLVVVEIGASRPEVILTAAEWLLQRDDLAASTIAADREDSLDYVPCRQPKEEIPGLFETGGISSVMLDAGRHGHALLHRPRFRGGPGCWYGVIEFPGTASASILDELQTIGDALFISVSLEDTVDLDDLDDVTPDSFPWNHWRLVAAAVRGVDGEWERRPGPLGS